MVQGTSHEKFVAASKKAVERRASQMSSSVERPEKLKIDLKVASAEPTVKALNTSPIKL